jgi:phenylacetate-CoA ligase
MEQVNAETLFVEILDEKWNCSPREKRPSVILLCSIAHPFIRYDIGDIGILDEKSTIQTYFEATNWPNQ